ncbi:MAG: hypothetical protein LWW98_02890 [Deltaproteobacteria bacterium]|nr:hypothetical protein [Deltaproteobacteria bacterium]
MKKLVSKKLLSILVVALFTICFCGVAIAEETVDAVGAVAEDAVGAVAEETGNVVEIKGAINNIVLDTGQVEVVEESGAILTVTATPDIDLTAFTEGDKVIILCSDNIIKSIVKQY